MKDLDINKLRRLALLFGLLLVTYSLAGIEITKGAKFTPFGLELTVKNPDLLGIGLLLGALYGLVRYWFYAVLTGMSPRRIRKRIISGTLADGSKSIGIQVDTPQGETEKKFKNLAIRDIETYFPVPPWTKKKIPYVIAPLNEKNAFHIVIEANKAPIITKILYNAHDLDYYAPIWFNLFAVLIYLLLLVF